jgi:membrane fusion protein, multidrug efflux system
MSSPNESQNSPSSSSPAATSANGNGQKSRFKSLAIIGIVFLVLALGGGLYWLTHASLQDTDDATIVGHLHSVSSRVSGTVEKVLVDDNQIVHAGDVLAVLDPTDYKLALSQAEHNLELAQSQALTAEKNISFAKRQANGQIQQAQGGLKASQSSVSQSKEAVREAKAAVETARQNVAQQNATYDKAAADYRRYTSLQSDAVSAQQLDAARTNMQVAQAGVAAAKASLAQSQARSGELIAAIGGNVSRVIQSRGTYTSAEAQITQVDIVKSQYQNALAQVHVAEDQVKQARLNLSYTVIKAPVDGRIGRKTVEVGQRIQPGEGLLSVVSTDIWVVANFKETQLEKMKHGQPVELAVDTFSHHHFKGWVDGFSPASGAQFALLPPENASGNFTKVVQRIPVKILFDRKSIRGFEDRLTPGMSVIVTVDTAENNNETHTTKTTTTHTVTTEAHE